MIVFKELLVPLFERRHRLYEHEIPEVINGLKLRLEQLLESREDSENAELTFRALFRLTRKNPGRPKYPQFDWNYIQHFLGHYESERAHSQGRF